MKKQIILTLASAALMVTSLHAFAGPGGPGGGESVPDSGETFGALAVGLLLLAAIRRKLVK